MAAIRDVILLQSEANIFVAWLIVLPLAIVALLFFPIIAFAYASVYTIADLLGESKSFPADATHVPTFYVPRHRYFDSFHILLLLALGSIFGGIHCGGWNFPFPTYAEQTLWRVASLAVTIMPIATFPLIIIIFLILGLLTCCCEDRCEDVTLPEMIAPGIVALLYVSARLILLGLAIAFLKHPPPSAFIAVDWTKFYPHIL